MLVETRKHTNRVYVISDIHNDYVNFRKMLKKIEFQESDTLYIVGDVFDKGYLPQPLELYREILKYKNIHVLRGNHDNWLAESIRFAVKHVTVRPMADSYYILKNRLSEQELLELEQWITSLPLQAEIEVEDTKYLLAHAQTAKWSEKMSEDVFLMGNFDKTYYEYGIRGVVSIVGHTTTDVIRSWMGERQRKPYEVWCNRFKNLYVIDCGNGIRKPGKFGPRLACMRLNDRKVFYV